MEDAAGLFPLGEARVLLFPWTMVDEKMTRRIHYEGY
jgi:hypothetical protein